ncbi:GNAT family N-acetyltransferase [Lichenicoccus sp.]|uniref:GNAT family N-acetyltransferase n=1 Tax=Lichenicoccus sp. TaxID=2781899 RepID=UPI003D0EF1EB
MPIRISAVAYQSAPYHDMLALRRRLLREPLGLVLTQVQLAAERDQVHLALWYDDVVAGTLLLVRPDAAGTARLRQMAVTPPLRGRGLGVALVRHAETMLRRLGARRIALSARETVVGFYERLGYQVEGERFIEVTIPHLCMARML